MTERLIVGLFFGTKQLEVGELVKDGIYLRFKFYPEFLDTGLEISPFKLPAKEGIFTGDTRLFDGLFGVFNDSLPDGWGRLLLDRALSSRGENPLNIGPLDRLAYVGKSALGALVYSPPSNDPSTNNSPIELDRLAQEMSTVLEGSSSTLIEELYQLGGSSGGARPKIHVGYNEQSDHLIHGMDDLPANYAHWIVKFPSSFDRPDIANIEYAYYLMALAAGLEMEHSKLFQSQSGAHYFGTKRFDRVGNQRLHVHSASGILHDDFRYSQMDYGHLMDCAFQLEKQVAAYEKILRVAAFNVFSHNRDDHSKNFSFLMDQHGAWRFSPVYDLTFSASSHGMQSTMVAGESRNPGEKQLLELAQVFSMKKPEEVLHQVKDAILRWPEFATQAGVSKESKTLITKALKGLPY